MKTATPMVHLEMAQPRFFGNVEDIDAADFGEVPAKTLDIPGPVWAKCIGMAETAGYPRTNNNRHLFPSQVAELAKCLRTAVETPLPAGRNPHLTTKGQILDFFSSAANRKHLKAVQALLDHGGTLTVS